MANIKLVVKIDSNVYSRLFDNGIRDNEISTDDIHEMARSLRLGQLIDGVYVVKMVESEEKYDD